MPPVLPVVRVVGWSKRGKTGVATRLVAAFRARGYDVAALKHSHHPVPADAPASDTHRLATAGAGLVVFTGRDGTVVRGTGVPLTLRETVDWLAGRADLLIAEGYKYETLGPAIEISDVGTRGSLRLRSAEGGLAAESTIEDVTPLVEALERMFHLTAVGSPRLRCAIRQAAVAHGHLCPGQVLGTRMALAGMAALGFDQPDPHRLFVHMEIDRCATDAVAAVTRCTLGKRRMRLHDYGKVAATFVDTETGAAVRVLAREETRDLVAEWAPGDLDPRHQQSIAYRLMPDALLFDVRAVAPAEPALARPPRRRCARCGETVNFGRTMEAGGATLCLPCGTGRTYYRRPAGDAEATAVSGPEPTRQGTPTPA